MKGATVARVTDGGLIKGWSFTLKGRLHSLSQKPRRRKPGTGQMGRCQGHEDGARETLRTTPQVAAIRLVALHVTLEIFVQTIFVEVEDAGGEIIEKLAGRRGDLTSIALFVLLE